MARIPARAFKTRWFHRWALAQGMTDEALRSALLELAAGLVDADLGGHVVKKRVALPGRGKRGGGRTLVAFRDADRAFFLYGFAKSERANVTQKELMALRRLAQVLLGYGRAELERAVRARELIEVVDDG